MGQLSTELQIGGEAVPLRKSWSRGCATVYKSIEKSQKYPAVRDMYRVFTYARQRQKPVTDLSIKSYSESKSHFTNLERPR
jgi:hypothetical protein